MSSGGGGGGNSTTVTSNIPEWLRPQTEALMGAATQQMFNTQRREDGTYDITGIKNQYKPYSTTMDDYVAGFSPLQRQVQANAANLRVPGQFQQGTQLAGMAGQGALDSADRAYEFGDAGFQSGRMGQGIGIAGGQRFGEAGFGSGMMGQQIGMTGGQQYGGMGAGYGARAADIGLMGLRAEELGRDITGQARGYAQQSADMGGLYERMATSPYDYQRFMSPYQQNVVDVQTAAARRQADISRTERNARAARAGAFGGARQAIENAEAERALQTQLDSIQAQGSQNAFQQAQQAINQRAMLGLQGLSGAQQGLGTALQGGSLGLEGIGRAMTGQQVGIQGAQTGLQGVDRMLAGTGQGMQGAQIGLQGVDRMLAGTGQGMQGAQVGLQGVSGAQAGFGLANQSASTLGNLGQQQLAAQTGILNLQNQIGAQQQALEQSKINQAIQNFAQEREAPMNTLNQYNALLRGYSVPGSTSTQYQAQPSIASQAAGLGLAGVGLANMGKKKGGAIKASEGIDKLQLRRVLARSKK